MVRVGRSVVVATGTASGKSLCYRLPVAEAALDPVRSGTSLLVFPTKALAQDQLRALAEMRLRKLVPVTYDGDSGVDERTWARRNANVVLTNPEMLHSGILPHHARWATFLMRLQYVVVDELHVLRGSSARTWRTCCGGCGGCAPCTGRAPPSCSPLPPSAARSSWQGTCAGSTCAPCWTTGRPVASAWWPCGTHPVSSTPLEGDDDVPGPGRRRSTNREAAGLTAELVESGHHTICFCRSRKGTEVGGRRGASNCPTTSPAPSAPRGGYLPTERREIEAELFSGRLRGVVATTALELGIDVGGLDACVLAGFPGTVASMWQQAGRAGRDGQQCLAVLVAGEDQLDQWMVAHPTELFTGPPSRRW